MLLNFFSGSTNNHIVQPEGPLGRRRRWYVLDPNLPREPLIFALCGVRSFKSIYKYVSSK